MISKFNAIGATLILLGLSGPTFGGPIADDATSAAALAESGDIPAALEEMDAVMAQIWDASPDIVIRNTLLVTDQASGYGIYNPRPEGPYKAGEPIHIYAEPQGFGYGTPAEGLYSMGFFVDLRVTDSTGAVLGELPNAADLEITSRYKNREFQANITYTLNGVAPGKYMLETTLRDKNSNKIGRFETQVEFAE